MPRVQDVDGLVKDIHQACVNDSWPFDGPITEYADVKVIIQVIHAETECIFNTFPNDFGNVTRGRGQRLYRLTARCSLFRFIVVCLFKSLVDLVWSSFGNLDPKGTLFAIEGGLCGCVQDFVDRNLFVQELIARSVRIRSNNPIEL